MKRKTIITLVWAFIIAATLVKAASQPEGPATISVNLGTSRAAPRPPSLNAYAGNISWLTITGASATQSWQGYVGNITGTITLDDASNNTLYDWSLNDPEGEIYATVLDSINWTTGAITCWNWTIDHITDANGLGLGELEGWDVTYGSGPNATDYNLGLAQYDVDGVNETFSEPNETTHTNFFVGAKLINGTSGPCPVTHLYNLTSSSSDRPGNVFEEVLLFHNTGGVSSDVIIYTAILTQAADNQTGYDGRDWDFEMIVGEDGHNGDTSTTTYYFYVELE